MATFQLGESVSRKGLTSIGSAAPPPVVLRAQPDSYVRLQTPEELQAWEEAVRATTGLRIDARDMAGSASESCSCGCSDDCCVDCAEQ
ncbi:hypothetical protein B7P34_00825 [Streptosporangium nondiastaticum]|uniref:Uncharacterized protein n=1 Tax=Streptosporangium nondiastaticum TaxID=35764 RepID=A0A9X7JVG2_9ACTN|nr:hypothetical protein B7P34_00825 [Streptosporangium nondiastaticum]